MGGTQSVNSPVEVSEIKTVSEVLMHCMRCTANSNQDPPAPLTGSLKLAKHISLLACTVHPNLHGDDVCT